MSEVLEVDPRARGAIARAVGVAASAVVAGALVVVPTETVYGIACRPDDARATSALFAAKRRPSRLSLPVLVGSPQAAWTIAMPSTGATALADAFWPGPLTIVLPRAERSAAWDLGEARATIALRVPDHPLTLAIVRVAGPIAATSANVSGAPPASDADELLRTFGDAVAVYVVERPRASSMGGRASTIVDLSGERPVIAREGPIDRAAIDAALAASTGMSTR